MTALKTRKIKTRVAHYGTTYQIIDFPALVLIRMSPGGMWYCRNTNTDKFVRCDVTKRDTLTAVAEHLQNHGML